MSTLLVGPADHITYHAHGGTPTQPPIRLESARSISGFPLHDYLAPSVPHLIPSCRSIRFIFLPFSHRGARIDERPYGVFPPFPDKGAALGDSDLILPYGETISKGRALETSNLPCLRTRTFYFLFHVMVSRAVGRKAWLNGGLERVEDRKLSSI